MTALTPSETDSPAIESFLLGRVEYDACLALQNRLVFESSGRRDGRITLLVCEHSPIVTVGRQGSWGHINLRRRELASRQLKVHWVNHGGGCMVHLPGQLAIYPIVPLEFYDWTVADYLRLLQQALVDGLRELGYTPRTQAGRYGVWGRTGQLAAVAVSVKHWTAYHGAFVNVSPAMELFRRVQTDPVGESSMSSLATEKKEPAKMSRIRETLLRHIASAFGCQRQHVYAGQSVFSELASTLQQPGNDVG